MDSELNTAGNYTARRMALFKGMAIIRRNRFSIYPESWAVRCGKQPYGSGGYGIKERFSGTDKIAEGVPQGWPVNMTVPIL